MCRVGKQKLVHDVLAYLVEYQDAQDTLEGIIEWWLVEQEIKHQTAVVKEVLAELVKNKLIIERKGIDARAHYRVNRAKNEEIRELLKEDIH